MKRVLLIRHAECTMNLHTQQLVGGRSNASPLTPLGRRQAAALGQHLAARFPGLAAAAASGRALVHSSTAVRACDTAAIMLAQWPAADAAAAKVAASPQLLELSQGSWEGAPRAQCYTPEVLARIAADPLTFAAPGGESQQQLEQRVAAYVNEAVLPALEWDGDGLPALVVSHGLAIKCFLRSVLRSDAGMTWKLRLDNTSIVELLFRRSGPAAGWQLECLNNTTHLALAGVTDGLPGFAAAAPPAREAGAETAGQALN